MEKNRRGSRSERTLRGSSSSALIEKNCLRSSSTWTCKVHWHKESLPNAKVQKPDWNTSARVHDATAEFPQILARGSELIIIHRKCGQDAWFSSGHTSVSCVAADRGQSGHQAHIYEMCLSAERGKDMDTGKEVLFALPLFKLFSPSMPRGVSVETTTGQHIDVIANFPVGDHHTTFQPSGGTEDGGSFSEPVF